jgi:glucokinase
MEELVLGLDIGGTKIAAGLVSTGGTLETRAETPTEQGKGFEHSFGRMTRLVDSILSHPLARERRISGIGACAPGPMDPARGILYNPPNLLGWSNLPLRSFLEERYSVPVRVDNDANAAGLAEALWGAGRGFRHVFYATVSTGIGTGIILDRKILHGKNGFAAEGGHVTIQFEDTAARCNCGNTGCIEAYASGTHAARRAREKLRGLDRVPDAILKVTDGRWEDLTMRHIAEAARMGDAFSLAVIEETGRLLGVWLGGIVSLLDPDIIVLGGGVAEIGEPLFEAIRREVPARTINPFARDTPIVKAALEKDVGILGAAALLLAPEEPL